MPDRHPTLWETYDMIFQALEEGRATIREVRQFHWLWLCGPSKLRMEEFMRLYKKIGIHMIPEGSLTGESLVAMARTKPDPNRKYDVETVSEKITTDEKGVRHLEAEIKFIARERPKSPKKKPGSQPRRKKARDE